MSNKVAMSKKAVSVFACPFCTHVSSSQKDLDRHLCLFGSFPHLLNCPFCSCVFLSQSELDLHLKGFGSVPHAETVFDKDVCPFTALPCGVSDLCWSAGCLRDGDPIGKECSATQCQGYIIEHFLHTKLCPFTDKPCVDVRSCKDALVHLLGFDPTNSHGYFGDFGISKKRSCPYDVVKVREGLE